MNNFKLLLLFSFFLTSIGSQAAHILGGDMDVQHVSDSTFHVTLTVFRNCDPSSTPLPTEVTIGVFEEGTNNPLTGLNFSISNPDVFIQELGDACFTPDICWEIGTYETDVTLPANSNGIYLVWERCCRDQGITNIVSNNDEGSVFIATIPDPAIQNSSPVFEDFPAEAYFCVDSEVSFSFGATDADGDSLVYSLVWPLIGALDGGTFDGAATPKPHNLAQWEPGYSLADILGSGIPLTVNSETGLVTGTAATQGQFVFAVLVEEFRDGIKLGEIMRDINAFSSAICNQDVPPVYVGFSSSTEIIEVDAFEEINISIVVEDNVTDTIIQTVESDIFTSGLFSVLAEIEYDTINVPVGGWNALIHWDSLDCDMIREEPYWVYFVTESESACPPYVTSFDTLNLGIIVNLPENSPTAYDSPETLYFPVQIEPHCFNVKTEDFDHWDTLSVRIQESEVLNLTNPASFIDSVAFTTSSQPIVIDQEFCWTPECKDVREEPYIVSFRAQTKNCSIIEDTLMTKEIFVYTNSDGKLDTIPNVFSPNDDELNVKWKIPHTPDICRVNENIQIFNRWGEPLYESASLLQEWDGRFNDSPVSLSDYFYVIQYQFLGEDFNYKGNVKLVR